MVSNRFVALCRRCGCDTEWSMGHGFDTDLYGDIHIVHTFVCDRCGTTVKEIMWPTYQRNAKRRIGGDECATDS